MAARAAVVGAPAVDDSDRRLDQRQARLEALTLRLDGVMPRRLERAEDRLAALSRALTEAIQVRTTYISGARDDLTHRDYGAAERARKAAWAARMARPYASSAANGSREVQST